MESDVNNYSYLNVIRFKSEQIEEIPIHPCGLKGPPGSLLIKQGPEYGQGQHHVGHIPHRLHLLHVLVPEGWLAPVKPVSLASNLATASADLDDMIMVTILSLSKSSTYPDASACLLDEIFLAPVRHVDLVHVEQFAKEKEEDSHEHESSRDPKGQGVTLVHAEAGHT